MDYQTYILNYLVEIAQQLGYVVTDERKWANKGRLVAFSPNDPSVLHYLDYEFQGGEANTILIDGAKHGPTTRFNHYFKSIEGQKAQFLLESWQSILEGRP